MNADSAETLRACGFLAKRHLDNLLGYFYVDLFGGLYEDMSISGIETYFPKCSPGAVALLRVELEAPDLNVSVFVKLLKAFQFSHGRDVRAQNFRNQLREAGFEEVRHATSGAANFLGSRLGLTWSFHLRGDGTLLVVEAYDVPLIAANAEDGSFTEDRIRAVLVEQLKISIHESFAAPKPEMVPVTGKRKAKKGESDFTKRLVDCGFLPKNFKEDLLGDFSIEGLGGLYEDLEVGGVQVLFPKCAGASVAALICSLESGELEPTSLAKVLAAHGFAGGSDLIRRNYPSELRAGGFEEVIHEASGAVSLIGDRLGITWSFHLRKDGTLLSLEAHDVPLVAANASQLTEAEVRQTLVEWVKTSARRHL